jgi:hypothetical protein
MPMIKEPESKYVDYLTNCGDLVHHYTVTHNNVVLLTVEEARFRQRMTHFHAASAAACIA